MRKRIAVFMGEICREFQTEFTVTLRAEAKKRNYDVFLFSNRGAYTTSSLFDEGERDIVNIPDLSRFEGVISLADTFDTEGLEAALVKKAKAAGKPVVSIRNGMEGTYRIMFSDHDMSYQMTKHFIDEHHFTRICYMTGPLDVDDAVQRFDGFKHAMSEEDLEVNEKNVFEGDYWTFKGEAAVDHFLKAFGDEIPQAIICANDHMAIAVSNAIKSRGLRIPEDICVAGNDDIVEAQGYRPSLTTVHMSASKMAENAFDILEGVNRGEFVDEDTLLECDIILRGSCGCGPADAYYDPSPLINQHREDFISIQQASVICLDAQNCITEEDKLRMIDSYFYRTKLKRAAICICEDFAEDKENEVGPYSDRMDFRRVFPLSDSYNDEPYVGELFDRADILPKGYTDREDPFFVVVFTLHHRNVTFGYLACEMEEDEFMTSFISGFKAGISSAFEDLRLQKISAEFAEIKVQNLHDPLTGLLNRRGFDQRMNSFMALNKDKGTPFTFISADMDNLKKINDNYGHLEGDEALKIFAEVLKSVTGENDIVARVGGDEFFIVLTSDPEEQEKFVTKAYLAVAMKDRELEKPYDLHASFGAYHNFSNRNASPFSYIQIADSKMYEEKRKYKAAL